MSSLNAADKLHEGTVTNSVGVGVKPVTIGVNPWAYPVPGVGNHCENYTKGEAN